MKLFKILISVLIFLPVNPHKELAGKLDGLDAFSEKKAQVFGYYSSGCIKGAVPLPERGTGYRVLRLFRKRYFGHPTLIEYIQELGRRAHQYGLGNILISDMSMQTGGPMLDSHISHQNGLDADISYELINDSILDEMTASDFENFKDVSIITSDFASLNPSVWNSSIVEVLRMAAASTEVERIYVDPLVKREICRKYSKEEWAARIRPWWNHHDHFHIRLKCPPGNSRCESQQKTNYKIDCGSALQWWFSKEARKIRNNYNIKKLRKTLYIPEYPDECK